MSDLQQLRKAKALTQAQLAKTPGIRQATIAKMEKRNDLMISTLGSHVETMGGRVNLVVEFPGALACPSRRTQRCRTPDVIRQSRTTFLMLCEIPIATRGPVPSLVVATGLCLDVTLPAFGERLRAEPLEFPGVVPPDGRPVPDAED